MPLVDVPVSYLGDLAKLASVELERRTDTVELAVRNDGPLPDALADWHEARLFIDRIDKARNDAAI